MMRSRIILTGLFFFLANLFAVAQGENSVHKNGPFHFAGAKGSLSGKITDAKTNEPLTGASVYFSDLRMGTTSGADGNFSVANLPLGKHLLEISFIGHASISEYIEISGDIKKDFALNTAVLENDAVVVTGVSGATQLKKSPISIAIVRKQELFVGTASNIIEALTKKSGVASLSTGPAVSKPVIRGLGYNRVVVLNDGVRQEGQQWGDEHGIEIDELSVSKVEIVKGPASLMYGSDAMAGVINIITNVPVAANTIKGNLFSNYQTNNRLCSFHADIAGNKKGVNWNVYGSIKQAGDYKNKYDGYVFNSKFKDRNFGGYIGFNGGWGFSHLLLSRFNQTLGVIEGERDNEGYFIKILPGADEERATSNDFKSVTPLVPYQEIKHTKIALDNSFNIGKSRLTGTFGYQDNRRIEHGNRDAPSVPSLFFDLKTFGYTLQYHLAEKNNWRTSIGLGGMAQNNKNKAAEKLIPDYNLFDIGGFIFTKKSFEKLTLSGGFRFDNRSLNSKITVVDGLEKFTGFNKSFSNFSGSAGFSYEASKQVILKLNMARGFRAPSIPELASNGEHEGTNRYEYGNRNLKSENSLQLDAGIEINTEHISLQANLFNNSINNFIFYRKLEAVNGGDSVINGATAFIFDQRKANLAGFELNIDIHPHPLDWLHIENNFSLVNGRFKKAVEGTKNIPFIPAAKLNSQVKGDFFKKGKTIRNLSVSVEAENIFKQNAPFTAFNTETVTKGYTLFNSGISTEIVSKNKMLCQLSFNVLNLGNVAYQNHLSRLKYTAENLATGRMGVFNMGRNFSIKVNVPLEL